MTPVVRPTIYFAAPLFRHAERRWNARLAAALETLGHRVLLPQRLVNDLIRPGQPMPSGSRSRPRSACCP